MTTKKKMEQMFGWLGRTEKCEFISSKIEYASMHAIVERAKPYIFDLLDECDFNMIKDYVESREGK
jgi:hypothetical protein